MLATNLGHECFSRCHILRFQATTGRPLVQLDTDASINTGASACIQLTMWIKVTSCYHSLDRHILIVLRIVPRLLSFTSTFFRLEILHIFSHLTNLRQAKRAIFICELLNISGIMLEGINTCTKSLCDWINFHLLINQALLFCLYRNFYIIFYL